jgi:transposase
LSKVSNHRTENGVRSARVWRALLGVDDTVVEGVEFDGQELVVRVRPARRARSRCGRCRARCAGYDLGAGPRRWRSLDLGTVKVFVQAHAPRVRCREHGVVVAHVPWARHGAGHTRPFDDTVAWLATQTSKSAATQLMRVAWRTVGAIIARVWSDIDTDHDRLAGLRRIGIDEISYRRGQQYLTVVVDHDSGRLVWAAQGRTKATLRRFFDDLGPERSAAITHVSADAADWIETVVSERCPAATRCTDPFHVVMWATDALDAVRLRLWREARALARRTEPRTPWGHHPAPPRPNTTFARALKYSRWALVKNPDNLNDKQHAKLAWIVDTVPELHRAYQLKEGLRLVFQVAAEDAAQTLDHWLAWARRCRIPEFVTLQRRIVRHRDAILAAAEHSLSNARVEAVNTKIRLITRVAFGFHSAQALIALAMLSLAGHRPTLPGRTNPRISH